ncbi:hypothetical protein HZP42_10225 [Elizabethkingia anophelis]|nr:hypothetical protein [Elizabethkingia anophelis]
MGNKKRIRKRIRKLQIKQWTVDTIMDFILDYEFRMPEIKTRSGVVHEAVIIQYPSLTPEESERLKMQLENIRTLGRSKV